MQPNGLGYLRWRFAGHQHPLARRHNVRLHIQRRTDRSTSPFRLLYSALGAIDVLRASLLVFLLEALCFFGRVPLSKMPGRLPDCSVMPQSGAYHSWN